MDNSPAAFPGPSMATPHTARAALVMLAAKAGAGAAAVSALLAGRVSEPVILVGVIVVASMIGWHRTDLTPARVRSHHRFTLVSRSGDGFVTIDSSGVRRVTRHIVLDTPSS
ncbi:MAG TPA: hypothetical protein VGC84_13370 [Ilumatobacteraceae bacterium]